MEEVSSELQQYLQIKESIKITMFLKSKKFYFPAADWSDLPQIKWKFKSWAQKLHWFFSCFNLCNQKIEK